MPDVELDEFFRDNGGLYASASAEDLEQLRKISLLYPDRVRLLSAADAVNAGDFKCRRCGSCCAAVKIVPACHSDVLRWLDQGRWDIFDRLVVDRRRTALMAVWGREAIAAAKGRAANRLEGSTVPEGRRPAVAELLYVTDLVESAVYAAREENRCAFYDSEGAACTIHDTKPRACEKFPFYVGKYTDPRLLELDFCPALKELAGKKP